MNEDEYWRALRGALRNLYDHAALRRNALAPLLALAAPERGVQEILLEAVQALAPQRGAAVQSDARRTHQVLQHRYVEQFSQSEVADSLALSERQLRRQEQLAIRTLGEHLRIRYALPIEIASPPEPRDAAGEVDDESLEPVPSEHFEEEIERLQQETPLEVLDISELVGSVIETLQPLLQRLDLAIDNHIDAGLPGVSANAVALRQALMIALAALARATEGRSILVEAEARGETLHMRLRAASSGNFEEFAAGESLAMAKRLLALSGGELTITPQEQEVEVEVTLPTAQTVTILIIDDNQDSLQLCQRYLTGTAFRPMLARDAAEGLALAERVAPQMILLDVMMPAMDGWETLARLRRHPATEGIPVVIFSILPEEPLAHALGAFGFLRKPFTRDELLEAIRSALNADPLL